MEAIAHSDTYGIWISDKELRKRWKCSQMKIWRMRNDGRLDKPTKVGGTGQNLNRLSHVEEVEERDGP